MQTRLLKCVLGVLEFFFLSFLVLLLRSEKDNKHCAFQIHCKNEYALSNQKKCGNRLQAILLIKFNKLELSNN